MEFIVKDSVYKGKCYYGDDNNPRNITAKLSYGSNKANYKGKQMVCDENIVTILDCPDDCEHYYDGCRTGKVKCNSSTKMFIEGKRAAVKGDEIIFPGGKIIL